MRPVVIMKFTEAGSWSDRSERSGTITRPGVGPADLRLFFHAGALLECVLVAEILRNQWRLEKSD